MAEDRYFLGCKLTDIEVDLIDRELERGTFDGKSELTRYCIRVALGKDAVLTPDLRRELEALATLVGKSPEEVSHLWREFVIAQIDRLKS